MLGFNDNIFTPARRSTDQAARAKAIARLAPWGGTALYDVIIRALDLLGRQSGRRALLVFSDGEDQSSHASMASVVTRAEASDATIYMIGQGRALQATALQQLMKRLATGSGGRAFFSGRGGEARDHLSRRSSTISVTSTCSATRRPTTRGTANSTGFASRSRAAAMPCGPGRATGSPAAKPQ